MNGYIGTKAQAVRLDTYTKQQVDGMLNFFYKRDNVVGTVSESAGVPTGAVIERGSNANGEYTKWADGTMICTGAVPASATGTVTYAATFITRPYNPGGGNSNANTVVDSWGTYNTSSGTGFTYRWATRTDALGHYLAIGRWY